MASAAEKASCRDTDKTVMEAPEAQQVHPASSIDPLIDYIQSLSEGDALDAHMRKKLQRNHKAYQLPAEDAATCMCPIREGVAVGLRSGKLMRVLPPVAETVELVTTPITALASCSSFLVVTTENSALYFYSRTKQIKARDEVQHRISSAEANTKKDIILIGCVSGIIHLFRVTEYDECKTEPGYHFPSPHQEGGEDKPEDYSKVLDIKTNDKTTWFAACYASKDITIYEHEDCALLYHFSLTGSTVFPTIFPQGQRAVLPDMYWQPMNWLVSPDMILLPSALIIKMSGRVVAGCYSLARPKHTSDSKWATVAAQRKKGHYVFYSGEYLVSVTKPGVAKTNEALKKWPLLEIDVGIPFSQAILSEYQSCLCLLGETAVEVVTAAAVESVFQHNVVGLCRHRYSTGAVHWRFQKMFADNGAKLLFDHEDTLLGPDISKNAEFGYVRYHKKDKGADIVNIAAGTKGRVLFNGESLMHEFSKDNKFILVVTKKTASVYRTDNFSLYYEIPGSFDEKTSVRFTESGALFVFGNGTVIFAASPELVMRDSWEYRKATRVWGQDNRFLGYSLTKMAVCSWQGVSMVKEKEEQFGFEMVRVFNSGTMCAGFSVSGIDVLALSFQLTVPSLEKLLHISNSEMLLVSRRSDLFCTFSFDPASSQFCRLRVWDLSKGLPVWNIETGLKTVLDASSEGPRNFYRGWTRMRIDFHRGDSIRLFRNWAFDFTPFTDSRCQSELEPSAMSLYEESFERHCALLKQLSDLALVGKFDPALSRVLIVPFRINILHVLVHRNLPAVLTQALASGTLIVRSAFGSPVRLCVERNSRKCLDSILEALVALAEANSPDLFSSLYHIGDELVELLQLGSAALPQFLRVLMRPKLEEVVLTDNFVMSASLPFSVAAESLWIERSKTSTLSLMIRRKNAVEYLIGPIPIHAELGTTESIEFLKSLVFEVDEVDVLNNDFLKTLVDMKWNSLWPAVLLYTLLYWIFLILTILRLFKSETDVDRVYLAFNSFFTLFELCQFLSSPRQYFRSRWNYVDALRCGFSFAWVATSVDWVTFITILLSVLQGITTFKTFAPTRFFVRMIYSVCIKTVSFIFIFIYSTLAFGLLFAAADPGNIPTFTSSWSLSSRLDMGDFDMTNAGGLVWAVFLGACLTNVVWLLNLLVSILGSAYEDFIPTAEGADVLAKAELVYQYENMMGWRRRLHRPPQYLQTCKLEASSGSEKSGALRISQLESRFLKLEEKLFETDSTQKIQDQIERQFLELRTMIKEGMMKQKTGGKEAVMW